MRTISVIFILFLLVSKGYSQVPTPPLVLSPNAASLGLYGDIPVSLFTGTPDIKIPLYEITVKDYQMPVYLSYHSSGIHVDQRPSWTGLGWSLFAGGVITRKKNGLADELDGRGDGSNTLATNSTGFYKSHSYQSDDYNYKLLNTTIWNMKEYLKYISGTPKRDKTPDEFDFSFAGYSGKFCLTHEGKWKVQCNKPIKVDDIGLYSVVEIKSDSMSNGTISKCFKGFLITTEDGTQYIFGNNLKAIEFSADFFIESNQYGEGWLASTWHLTKIILPDKHEINFTYERVGFHNQLYYGTFYYGISGNGCSYATGDLFDYSGTLIYPSYLSKIETDDIKISFKKSISNELNYKTSIYSDYYSEYRSYYRDHHNGIEPLWPLLYNKEYDQGTEMSRIRCFKLDSIIIQNKDNSETLKTISLKYTNKSTQRLSLDSITESGKTPYSFEYYNIDKLPDYLANKTDHWGYYNGTLANHNNETVYYDSRNPNATYTKYGVLTKIKYPTGGYTLFEYEAHKYRKQLKLNREELETYSSDVVAGGVRIKSIKNYDSDNTLAKTKEYYYVSDYPNSTSSGIVGGQISYFYYYEPETESGYASFAIFAPISFLPACRNTEGSHIGYTKVIEKNPDNSYTEYQFTNFDNGYGDKNADTNLQKTRVLYDPYNSRAHFRGQLLNRNNYTASNKLVSSKAIEYYGIDNENYVRALSNVFHFMPCSPANNYFDGTAYRINMDMPKTKKETEISNDINGANPVTVETNYQYDSRNQLTTKETTGSDKITLKTELKYPYDFTETVYNSMVSNNILSPIIEQLEYKNNVFLMKNRIEYKDWGGGIFAPQYIKSQTKFVALETRLTYHNYDTHGNPLYISKDDEAEKTVYLWGYNYQYLVAEIKNATYSTVKQILTETLINRVASATTPTVSDLNAINNLRSNTTLKDAHITTYTYKPLVGMLTSKDPRGVETQYVYDTFGRLTRVILDGKTIEEYQYNYKN
jgi:YD repeat-containing protein